MPVDNRVHENVLALAPRYMLNVLSTNVDEIPPAVPYLAVNGATIAERKFE
jgi:hypothetical protein